jgi:hypothetical protein
MQSFLRRTVALRENRLSLEEMFGHPLVKKLLQGSMPASKYLHPREPHEPHEQKHGENKTRHDHHVSKV